MTKRCHRNSRYGIMDAMFLHFFLRRKGKMRGGGCGEVELLLTPWTASSTSICSCSNSVLGTSSTGAFASPMTTTKMEA